MKLQENDDLSDVKDGYTKLFNTFEDLYTNEKELTEKNDMLTGQVNWAIEELDAYRKSTEADALTIKELKEQLKRAKHLTDDAHAREQQAQEIIENMRQQIVKLNTELELKSRLAVDAEEEYIISTYRIRAYSKRIVSLTEPTHFFYLDQVTFF